MHKQADHLMTSASINRRCTCCVEGPLPGLVHDGLAGGGRKLRDDLPAGLAHSQHPPAGPILADAGACPEQRAVSEALCMIQDAYLQRHQQSTLYKSLQQHSAGIAAYRVDT